MQPTWACALHTLCGECHAGSNAGEGTCVWAVVCALLPQPLLKGIALGEACSLLSACPTATQPALHRPITSQYVCQGSKQPSILQGFGGHGPPGQAASLNVVSTNPVQSKKSAAYVMPPCLHFTGTYRATSRPCQASLCYNCCRAAAPWPAVQLWRPACQHPTQPSCPHSSWCSRGSGCRLVYMLVWVWHA